MPADFVAFEPAIVHLLPFCTLEMRHNPVVQDSVVTKLPQAILAQPMRSAIGIYPPRRDTGAINGYIPYRERTLHIFHVLRLAKTTHYVSLIHKHVFSVLIGVNKLDNTGMNSYGENPS